MVAVTQRTEYVSQYNETRDCLDRRWTELLTFCGITPLVIPNHCQAAQRIVEENSLQGVLFTGGNDSESRMLTEKWLLEFAMQNKLPVLGVCHGMQMIQQYFGVKLQKVSGHVAESQGIIINGVRTNVNSYHDEGATQTLPELIVWAKAEDGVIKAVQHSDFPITGIMWHPERCNPFKIRDIQLIKKVFAGEFLECGQLY
jgi:gamma-glutamyl-gamma-aminobutyrate hydrolase PuuD